MNATHEYALLIAVAAPFAALAAMNLYLMMRGERGTLLLPATGAYPSIALETAAAAAPAPVARPSADPANDETVRLAA